MRCSTKQISVMNQIGMGNQSVQQIVKGWNPVIAGLFIKTWAKTHATFMGVGASSSKANDLCFEMLVKENGFHKAMSSTVQQISI